MNTEHGERFATRRVVLIVTVLVAAVLLGACGSGKTLEVTGPGTSIDAVATDAAALTGEQNGDVLVAAGSERDVQAGDVGGGTGDDEAGRSATTSVKSLHRYGEVTDPNAGTGSWSSMAEFLEFVLFDADAYWQSVFADHGFPSPYVEYIFPAPGESYSTSCGVTDDRTAFYCPADDLIVFSQEFASDLWDGSFTLNGRQVPGGGGDMAPAFIVAHEFAHSLQGELGVLDGRYTSLQTELHADCWAGVWAASAADAGMFDDGDIEESLLAAWVIGDTDDADRSHGTSEERIDAFFLGFDTGDPATCGEILG